MIKHRSQILCVWFLIWDLILTAVNWGAAYHIRFETGWIPITKNAAGHLPVLAQPAHPRLPRRGRLPHRDCPPVLSRGKEHLLRRQTPGLPAINGPRLPPSGDHRQARLQGKGLAAFGRGARIVKLKEGEARGPVFKSFARSGVIDTSVQDVVRSARRIDTRMALV
jgi:hypothetical protein